MTLKIFDFRWPRPYQHTAGLPCGADEPAPRPPTSSSAARPRQKLTDYYLLGRVSGKRPTVTACSHPRGLVCRWHRLAASHAYRPNGTLLSTVDDAGSNLADAPVYSLAKSSDASGSFYAGVGGAALELALGSSASAHDEDEDEDEVEDGAYAGPAAGKEAWRRTRTRLSLLETGDGVVADDEGDEPDALRPAAVPPLRGQKAYYSSHGTQRGLVFSPLPRVEGERGRLDAQFYMPWEVTLEGSD